MTMTSTHVYCILLLHINATNIRHCLSAGVRVFPTVPGEPRLPAVDREEGDRPEVRAATARAI